MGLKSLIDSWKVSTFLFYMMLQFLRFLRKIGFKIQEDPWRYTTRIYHHLDHCSFGLAAFNLRPPGIANISDKTQLKEQIISHLSEFLLRHPLIERKIKWLRYSVKVLPNYSPDFVLAEFDDSFRLQNIRFFPNNSKLNISESALVEKISEFLIEEYNNFQSVSDEKRPVLLKKLVLNRAKQTKANFKKVNILLERMLSAVFVHFEPDTSDELYLSNRFRVPKFFQMRSFGFGSMNLHVKISPENKVDMWIQFNHAVIDGEPAAVIIHDLEKMWRAEPVTFMEKQINLIRIDDCISYECRLKLCVASGILNFQNVANARRKLHLQFQDEINSPITFAGLILWGLGHTSLFKNTKFLIPVNLPQNPIHKQTLGLLYIRPGKYANTPARKKSFLTFQKEFNKQIESTLLRKSEQYKVLEDFSIMPHLLYRFSTNYLLKPLQEVVGSCVLSVLKSPSFFIAPYALTKTGAAIAIANIHNPSNGFENFGAITIKGPSNMMDEYGKALTEMLENFDKYITFPDDEL